MMMTAVVSAANPFTDVPQDSWAYQSVTELANSGIILIQPDQPRRAAILFM